MLLFDATVDDEADCNDGLYFKNVYIYIHFSLSFASASSVGSVPLLGQRVFVAAVYWSIYWSQD